MDINIQIIDMDVMIGEQIHENADGSVTIFLNARHTYENRLIYYKHALKHLISSDFSEIDADKVERQAHEKEASKKLLLVLS